MDNQLTLQNTKGLKFQLLLSVIFTFCDFHLLEVRGLQRIVRNHTPK